jgi:hypothetical protein
VSTSILVIEAGKEFLVLNNNRKPICLNSRPGGPCEIHKKFIVAEVGIIIDLLPDFLKCEFIEGDPPDNALNILVYVIAFLWDHEILVEKRFNHIPSGRLL